MWPSAFLFLVYINDLPDDAICNRAIYAKDTTFYFKACVRYVLSNFYFSPNDSSSKTMKNIFYLI